MFTARDIAVDAFVKVDTGCSITWEMSGDEIECQFGGRYATGMTLLLSKASLEKLIATGTDALRAAQSGVVPQ
jgi:hypothetical protein